MYCICVFDILRTMASLRTIQEIPIYSTGSRMVHRSSTSFVYESLVMLIINISTGLNLIS